MQHQASSFEDTKEKCLVRSHIAATMQNNNTDKMVINIETINTKQDHALYFNATYQISTYFYYLNEY